MDPFWKQRGFLVAAAFLTATVVLSVGVLLFTGGNGKDGGSGKAAEGRRSAAVRSDSACGMPAGDQRLPLTPPAAHWDQVGEYDVPGASNVGPGVTDGHVRRCYAHSATGAVFAAINYGALVDTYSTDVAMLRELTAPSTVRDEGLRTGGSPQSDSSITVQVAGFRVTDYSPRAATVRLALHAAPAPSAEGDMGQIGAQLVQLTMRLLWIDGDWKVVADPDRFQADTLRSLAGLVVWSAP